MALFEREKQLNHVIGEFEMQKELFKEYTDMKLAEIREGERRNSDLQRAAPMLRNHNKHSEVQKLNRLIADKKNRLSQIENNLSQKRTRKDRRDSQSIDAVTANIKKLENVKLGKEEILADLSKNIKINKKILKGIKKEVVKTTMGLNSLKKDHKNIKQIVDKKTKGIRTQQKNLNKKQKELEEKEKRIETKRINLEERETKMAKEQKELEIVLVNFEIKMSDGNRALSKKEEELKNLQIKQDKDHAKYLEDVKKILLDPQKIHQMHRFEIVEKYQLLAKSQQELQAQKAMLDDLECGLQNKEWQIKIEHSANVKKNQEEKFMIDVVKKEIDQILREVKKMCEIRFNEYNKTQEKYYWIQAQEKQFQRRVQAYKFQVKTLENGKKDIFSVQNQLLQANTGLKELKEKYICKINSERGNNMEDVKNREARTKFEEEMMQEYLRSRSATNSSHTQQDSINMEYYKKKTSKENLHRQNSDKDIRQKLLLEEKPAVLKIENNPFEQKMVIEILTEAEMKKLEKQNKTKKPKQNKSKNNKRGKKQQQDINPPSRRPMRGATYKKKEKKELENLEENVTSAHVEERTNSNEKKKGKRKNSRRSSRTGSRNKQSSENKLS